MAILILISLGTLIVIALISVLIGGSFDNGINQVTTYNSGESWYDIAYSNFYIDEFTGALVIIIGLVALVSIIGIRIFDSGLSDSTVRSLTILIGYFALWGIFSSLAYDLIISIQLLGAFIYIFLTILFVVGVFQTIHN